MTCEIVIECNTCGKVVFGNAMFPEEVPDLIDCPSCGTSCEVLSKELVNREVVISIEKVPVTMVGKKYGKKEGSKRVTTGKEGV